MSSGIVVNDRMDLTCGFVHAVCATGDLQMPQPARVQKPVLGHCCVRSAVHTSCCLLRHSNVHFYHDRTAQMLEYVGNLSVWGVQTSPTGECLDSS